MTLDNQLVHCNYSSNNGLTFGHSPYLVDSSVLWQELSKPSLRLLAQWCRTTTDSFNGRQITLLRHWRHDQGHKNRRHDPNLIDLVFRDRCEEFLEIKSTHDI